MKTESMVKILCFRETFWFHVAQVYPYHLYSQENVDILRNVFYLIIEKVGGFLRMPTCVFEGRG